MSILTKITTAVTGNTITAAIWNEEFDQIYNDYNGGIVNANISASAAIAWSKISKTGSILDDIGDVTVTSATTNDVLTWNGSAWVNQAATNPSGIAQFERHIYNVLETGTGMVPRFYNKSGATKTISGVFLYCATAPTGASIIVDVNLNGTTIFTTQGNRPAISAGGQTNTPVAPDVTDIDDGEYLDFDIDQVGSTIPGADLLITVYFA